VSIKIKIIEILTRVLFIFYAFIAYISFFWFPKQNSLWELVFAIILIFLAVISYKRIINSWYIFINFIGMFLLIYLVLSSYFSINLESIIFYIIQILSFVTLIYISSSNR